LVGSVPILNEDANLQVARWDRFNNQFIVLVILITRLIVFLHSARTDLSLLVAAQVLVAEGCLSIL
jgi:hypothetical protein